MSPVARTCVPPHSSMLKPGTLTTRTLSPYFSPNSAIAPAAIASCVDRTSVCDRRVAADLLVDDPLDAIELVARDRLEVHEVEPQAIGRDERSGLLHVRAEHLAQRRVQQVRRRVVAARRVADVGVDLRGDDVADAQRAVRRRGRDARAAGPARMRASPSTVADAPVASLTMRPVSDTWPPASR